MIHSQQLCVQGAPGAIYHGEHLPASMPDDERSAAVEPHLEARYLVRRLFDKGGTDEGADRARPRTDADAAKFA